MFKKFTSTQYGDSEDDQADERTCYNEDMFSSDDSSEEESESSSDEDEN